jgi:hypothetical protein
MDKLTRYKKERIFGLQDIFYGYFKTFKIAEIPNKDWGFYRKWSNKIKTTKRLPQTKYITNTDVCNID